MLSSLAFFSRESLHNMYISISKTFCIYVLNFHYIYFSIFFRYAIGHAERSGASKNIGWLAHLANATDTFYFANNTGGPSIKSRYITSMYFTFTTLTSVGFGNVAPNTSNEKIYAIIVMMIGCKKNCIILKNFVEQCFAF